MSVFDFFNNDLMQALSIHIHCGQTAAWLGATCKRLYHLVQKCKRLKMLMRYHVINTDNFNEGTLFIEKDVLFERSSPNIDKKLATLLWYKHGLNVFLLEKILKELYCYMDDAKRTYLPMEFIKFLEKFLGEYNFDNKCSAIDDKGNLTMINDFYSHSNRKIEDEKRVSYFIDIEKYEHLQNVLLPGTFTWRYIIFERLKSVTIAGREHHRGTCTQIIIRNHFTEHSDLIKDLKKWKLPRQMYVTKRTKKQKKRQKTEESYDSHWINQPPPTIEFKWAKYLHENIKNI